MKSLLLILALAGLTPPLAAEQPKVTAAQTYQVPYRLTRTNHVLVRVKINGKGPFHFILDTGAPALFVSTAVSRKLGVTPDKQGWGTFAQFMIEGGVVLKNARGRVEDPFQLEGMNGLGLAGAELHGIIGYTVLARYRLGFDFTQDKLSWTPLDFEPSAPPGLEHKAPGGLDALGSIMKMLGAVLGKKPEQEVTLRGFLGMGVDAAASPLRITAVLPGAPAAEAGLKVGDRLRQFQGKPVPSLADLQQLLAGLSPGDTATLSILRGGEERELRIRIGRGL